MDTVTVISQRRPESVPAAIPGVIPGTSRTLTVTATYLLSEEGRKASLLEGGDGKAVQQLTLHVPANRLHLVSVDANGVARLRLRPRFQLSADNRVVRIDSAPTYDAPPQIEELFREAAKNHQLERAYEDERRSAKVKHREEDQERRAAVARTFLGDPTQRALVHPMPTPKRCLVATEQGRILFDANADAPPARDVPAEAHRRFRADLRARREHNLKMRAEQMALHEEKKKFIADWVSIHGTPEQQARQTVGVLPMAEAIEAITDHAFAALVDRRLYVPDGVGRVQHLLKSHQQHQDASVRPADVVVTGVNAETMTAAQWALVNDVRALLPEATVTLRVHRIGWRHDSEIVVPPIFGVVVTQRVGPFTLRREYAVPAAEGTTMG